LTFERRVQLLNWATRVGAYVVEDDYDSDFRFDGPPLTAVAGLDSSAAVIYLGTFSKSIGAGLRVGYLVVPVELAETAITVKAILNAGQSWLDQAVLAEFLSSGAFARHLKQVRMVYRSRRDCILSALREHFGDVNVSGHNGGMHIMWHLPARLPHATVVEATALNHGVGIYALRSAVAYVWQDAVQRALARARLRRAAGEANSRGDQPNRGSAEVGAPHARADVLAKAARAVAGPAGAGCGRGPKPGQV